MTKRDLKRIGIIAAITIISLTLPGLLWQRGLMPGWALALIGGYILAAVLGYALGRG
jgi:hypothetical protein